MHKLTVLVAEDHPVTLEPVHPFTIIKPGDLDVTVRPSGGELYSEWAIDNSNIVWPDLIMLDAAWEC